MLGERHGGRHAAFMDRAPVGWRHAAIWGEDQRAGRGGVVALYGDGMSDERQDLTLIADRQLNVVSRSDLASCGVTDHMTEHRVRSKFCSGSIRMWWPCFLAHSRWSSVRGRPCCTSGRNSGMTSGPSSSAPLRRDSTG